MLHTLSARIPNNRRLCHYDRKSKSQASKQPNNRGCYQTNLRQIKLGAVHVARSFVDGVDCTALNAVKFQLTQHTPLCCGHVHRHPVGLDETTTTIVFRNFAIDSPNLWCAGMPVLPALQLQHQHIVRIRVWIEELFVWGLPALSRRDFVKQPSTSTNVANKSKMPLASIVVRLPRRRGGWLGRAR